MSAMGAAAIAYEVPAHSLTEWYEVFHWPRRTGRAATRRRSPSELIYTLV